MRIKCQDELNFWLEDIDKLLRLRRNLIMDVDKFAELFVIFSSLYMYFQAICYLIHDIVHLVLFFEKFIRLH